MCCFNISLKHISPYGSPPFGHMRGGLQICQFGKIPCNLLNRKSLYCIVAGCRWLVTWRQEWFPPCVERLYPRSEVKQVGKAAVAGSDQAQGSWVRVCNTSDLSGFLQQHCSSQPPQPTWMKVCRTGMRKDPHYGAGENPNLGCVSSGKVHLPDWLSFCYPCVERKLTGLFILTLGAKS